MELGRVGIWSGQFGTNHDAAKEAASELEGLGYSALWFPTRSDIFELAKDLLNSTQRIVAATGIVNIWEHSAAQFSMLRQILLARKAFSHPSARPHSKMPRDKLSGQSPASLNVVFRTPK